MRTHLDLFSGIGGFALACRWNNIQTVGFVEYEDYPRRVLSKQFPGVPLFGDIRDFDATPFRGVDLLTGGYPCQPFSQAGKRKGKEDVRHLWPEMFRVITQARPSWVLAENVAGHINLGLDEVLLDLESEGYTCRTIMVPACAKNAPHRRDRVWVVARHVDDAKGAGSGRILRDLPSADEGQRQPEECREDQTWESVNAGKDVAHSQCHPVRDEGLGQDAGETSSLQGELRERQRIRVDPSECSKDVAHSKGKGLENDGQCSELEREQLWRRLSEEGSSSNGQNSGFFKSHLGRGTDGLSEGLDMPRRWGDGTWEEGAQRVTTEKKNRTHRLKALGNAIVPQIAYELIRCMKEIDESE